MKMTVTKMAMLLAMAAAATACQRSEERNPSPSAATPAAAQPAAQSSVKLDPEMQRMMELLRVVYGARGAGSGDHVLADLPDYGLVNEKSSYRIMPLTMRELGPDRVALVANANAANDVSPSHGQPGLLNVYLLRKQGGKWTEERRFENVAEMGSWGNLGSVDWVELGAGRPGFVVLSGGTWQGTTITNMALFDLADPRLRDLATKIGLVESDNEGDCDERRHYCWNVEGKWRFERHAQQAYDDLVFEFGGFEEARPEDSAETVQRQRSPVGGSARYAFQGGEYVLAGGKHAVPNP